MALTFHSTPLDAVVKIETGGYAEDTLPPVNLIVSMKNHGLQNSSHGYYEKKGVSILSWQRPSEISYFTKKMKNWDFNFSLTEI